jgi:hypothetical protein
VLIAADGNAWPSPLTILIILAIVVLLVVLVRRGL